MVHGVVWCWLWLRKVPSGEGGKGGVAPRAGDAVKGLGGAHTCAATPPRISPPHCFVTNVAAIAGLPLSSSSPLLAAAPLVSFAADKSQTCEP